MDLSSDDTTLILASDGVFEFMSDEEVVDLVCNGNAADADDACSQVSQHPASKRLSGISLTEVQCTSMATDAFTSPGEHAWSEQHMVLILPKLGCV